MGIMELVRKATGLGADVSAAAVIERLAEMKQEADAAGLEPRLAKTDDAQFLAAAEKRRQSEGVTKTSNTNTTTKTAVLEAIRKVRGGLVAFAKQELASDGLPMFTKAEATQAVTEHFKIYRPGSPDQAFARGIATAPEGPVLMKWIKSCRDAGFAKAAYAELSSTPRFTAQPRQVGGKEAFDSVNNPKAALDILNELAAEVKAKHPFLTPAQAFARVYQDRANADLVARERGENRPCGVSVRTRVTPPRAAPSGSSPA